MKEFRWQESQNDGEWKDWTMSGVDANGEMFRQPVEPVSIDKVTGFLKRVFGDDVEVLTIGEQVHVVNAGFRLRPDPNQGMFRMTKGPCVGSNAQWMTRIAVGFDGPWPEDSSVMGFGEPGCGSSLPNEIVLYAYRYDSDGQDWRIKDTAEELESKLNSLHEPVAWEKTENGYVIPDWGMEFERI